MMLGHVIVVGKEVNHRLVNLDVEIVVPRKDLLPSVKCPQLNAFELCHLLIPPPSQK